MKIKKKDFNYKDEIISYLLKFIGVHNFSREEASKAVKVTEACKALNISTRTLQRNLKKQNTSFIKILETIRKEKSNVLLKGKYSIEVITLLLCYIDRNSYAKAHKDWFGVCPTVYRKQLKEQNPN